MIHIKSADAIHQYDEQGRAITTWDDKKCAWIVNPEFENQEIDWWGNDNDFPAGKTLKDFISSNPTWDKKPDITVKWTWKTKHDMIACLGAPTSIPEREWYDKTIFPFSDSRSWGHLEYNKEEAIMYLGKYCGFNKNSTTVVTYNNEVIFEGILE